MTMLQESVDLQQEVRQYPMGILARGEALPDDWESGVTFRTTDCSEPEIVAICEVTDSSEVRPADASFDSILIRQSAACSTISQIGTTNIARRRLEGTTEWALSQALSAGVGAAGNPSRAGADVVHAVDDVDGNRVLQMIEAVACMEQAVADTGYGATAYLHAPPQVAPYLQAANLIDNFGHTPTGLIWVISPGYQPDAGANTSLWIWATGGLWAGVSPVENLLDGVSGRPIAKWRMNLDAAYAQRAGLAAFDPCINLMATVATPACNGGS